MNISINVSCADISEAMEVLKKLGDKVQEAVVTSSAPAPAEPVKRTRQKKTEDAAPVATSSEEVDPVAPVPSAPETATVDADKVYADALADARACIAGKGAGEKEKALVAGIKSQCLAITGSQDTNAVVQPADKLELAKCIRELIAKYKGE